MLFPDFNHLSLFADMSLSVQEIGRLNNGTRVPLDEYKLGSDEEQDEEGVRTSSLYLPYSLLWEQATAGILKLVHFSFYGGSLHEILGQADIILEAEDGEEPEYHQLVLNARIILATFSRARKATTTALVHFPETVEVVLAHVDRQLAELSAAEINDGDFLPACVVWNAELSRWSDAGCRLVATNASHTTCRCTRLGPYSLAMRAPLHGAAGQKAMAGAASSAGGISVVTLQIVTYIVAAISVLCVILILLKVGKRSSVIKLHLKETFY
jgi:hypothetical protein